MAADGCGTSEMMRRSGGPKPVLWRWRERFMQDGIGGLLPDKTRKPLHAPLPAETDRPVVDLAQCISLGNTIRWTGPMLTTAVQRMLEIQ